ncbi:MAG: hypothetical protein EON54_25000, partial [Alcaligenaceae bacterium]
MALDPNIILQAGRVQLVGHLFGSGAGAKDIAVSAVIFGRLTQSVQPVAVHLALHPLVVQLFAAHKRRDAFAGLQDDVGVECHFFSLAEA